MSFLAALQFLTTIPLLPRRKLNPEELGRSLGYFPVVGLLIGLMLAALSWMLGLILPAAVVNILLVIALVVITGALHLDGLADTCDGLGGYRTPEERLEVMRDSRIGGFGAIGVSCLLLAEYVSLNSVPVGLLMGALVLMPVLSRWAMVYAVFAYPYARPSGLGKAFKQQATWQKMVIATIVALAVAMILFQLAGLALMLGVWLITLAMAAYLKRKFGGLTGDTYGAMAEVTEVGVLILVLLLAGLGPLQPGGILG